MTACECSLWVDSCFFCLHSFCIFLSFFLWEILSLFHNMQNLTNRGITLYNSVCGNWTFFVRSTNTLKHPPFHSMRNLTNCGNQLYDSVCEKWTFEGLLTFTLKHPSNTLPFIYTQSTKSRKRACRAHLRRHWFNLIALHFHWNSLSLINRVFNESWEIAI